MHTENRRLLFYFDPFTASDRSKLLLALRDWVIDEWAAKEIPRPKQRKPSSSPVDPLIQAAFDGMEGKNNHGRSMRSERGCRSTQTLAPRASARPSLNERRYHPYSRTVAVKEPSARQVGPSEDATGKHESPPELVESVRMLQLSLPELTLEPPTFSSMTGG